MIEAALKQLPEKYRVVFVLWDVEGMSVKETAEALGLTMANKRQSAVATSVLVARETECC